MTTTASVLGRFAACVAAIVTLWSGSVVLAGVVASPVNHGLYSLLLKPAVQVPSVASVSTDSSLATAQLRGGDDGSLPVFEAMPSIDMSRWLLGTTSVHVVSLDAFGSIASGTPTQSGPTPFALGLFGLGLVGLWRVCSAAARR